jgi:hypothetical protein
MRCVGGRSAEGRDCHWTVPAIIRDTGDHRRRFRSADPARASVELPLPMRSLDLWVRPLSWGLMYGGFARMSRTASWLLTEAMT